MSVTAVETTLRDDASSLLWRKYDLRVVGALSFLKVLIAEDNAILAFAWKAAVEKAGMSAIVATTPGQLINAILLNRPWLAIVDRQLKRDSRGNTDGYEAVRAMKEIGYAGRIIGHTGTTTGARDMQGIVDREITKGTVGFGERETIILQERDLVEMRVKRRPYRDVFRNLWRKVSREDYNRRTVLAIVQGVVERSDEYSLMYASSWLRDMENMIGAEDTTCMEARKVERRIRDLNFGLQLFDAERDPVEVRAVFGVVQAVEDEIADVSLYLREAHMAGNLKDTRSNESAPVIEGIRIPVIDLPRAYGRPRVWIAWVERSYGNDCEGQGIVKGRFEPGGSLD